MPSRPCFSRIWVVYFLIASSTLPSANAKLSDLICWRALTRPVWKAAPTPDAEALAKRLKFYSAQGFEAFTMFNQNFVRLEEHGFLRVAAQLTRAEQEQMRRQLPRRQSVGEKGQIFLSILELALMDSAAWSQVVNELAEMSELAVTFESLLPTISRGLPDELRQSLLRQFPPYPSVKRGEGEYPLVAPKRLIDRYLKYILRGDSLIQAARSRGKSIKDAYRTYWHGVESVLQIKQPLTADFMFTLLEEIQAELYLSQSPNLRFQPEVIVFGSAPNARADTSKSDLDLAIYDATQANAEAIMRRLKARLDQAFPGHNMTISQNNLDTAFMLQIQSVVFRVRPWRIDLVVSDLDHADGPGHVTSHGLQ